MKRLFYLICIFCSMTTACQEDASQQTQSSADASSVDADMRIISLGGFVTEVLFGIGYGDQIVGIDNTSTYPAATKEIPKLGHTTQLSEEGILQLRPNIIFAEASPESKPVLDKVANAGIKVVYIENTQRLDNAWKTALKIAAHVAVPQQVLDEMKQNIQQDSLRLAEYLKNIDTENKPSVLFLYARGAGRMLVAGQNTTANSVIDYAGGENAIKSFEGFKALTPEYLLEAAPEVILMFETGLASLDGEEGLKMIPGMEKTPAIQGGRVIAMDGAYLLGFGPREASAVYELAQQFHPYPN